MVNVSQLARLANRAPATVQARIQRGEIEAVAKDALGRLLFDAAAVELLRNAIGGASGPEFRA